MYNMVSFVKKKGAEVCVYKNTYTITDYRWTSTSEVKLIVSLGEASLEDWGTGMGRLIFHCDCFYTV